MSCGTPGITKNGNKTRSGSVIHPIKVLKYSTKPGSPVKDVPRNVLHFQL
jgi:hypothetical protein